MTANIDRSLGFAPVTAETWLQPDPYGVSLMSVGTVGRKITGEDWVALLSEPQLAASVPIDIVALFEAARGALCYGYFFRPLCGLGVGQLFRVLETAVSMRCKEEGQTGRSTFEKNISYLIGNGIISPDKKEIMHIFRECRNGASHLEFQPIPLPGDACHLLSAISELPGPMKSPPEAGRSRHSRPIEAATRGR